MKTSFRPNQNQQSITPMQTKLSFLFHSILNSKRQRRSRLSALRISHATGLLATVALLSADHSIASTVTWIGGDNNWVNGGSNSLWFPSNDPTFSDDVIFNTGNSVDLGSSNSIRSLSLTNGISLDTQNFDLSLTHYLRLEGIGTDLTIGGSGSLVTATSGSIDANATIILDEGALQMSHGSGTGVLTIKAGGTLTGQGIVSLERSLSTATLLMTNDGTLRAGPTGLFIGLPPTGTLTVNATDANARLDLDGSTGNGIVNVGSNQLLDINVELSDAFGGGINLYRNSKLDLSAAWSMDGTSTIDVENGANGTFLPASTSFISGAAFTQTGGTISVIDSDGTLQFDAPFIQSGGNIINNGTVVFNANTTIQAGSNFTGTGLLRANSSVSVTGTTTFNMSGGSVDLDGSDLVGDTILIQAPLTVNVATFEAFGKDNTTGVNYLEVDHYSGSAGTLTVNLDDPDAEWTLNPHGELALLNDSDAGPVTLLSGSGVNIDGDLWVTGDVRSEARLDISGTVSILTAGKPFRLSGGGLPNTNRLLGGIINGPGILAADADTWLRGHGTINADIDFDEFTELAAKDGTLVLNGSVLGAGTIGTYPGNNILDVVNAWSTSISGVQTVRLNGGELKGGTLTVGYPSGIVGRGLVSCRIINETKIEATYTGKTLVVETAAHNNDWDGVSGNGILKADEGTLEVRDTASTLFSGTVEAVDGGTVFANGFAIVQGLDSTVNLFAGTFKQSVGTDNLILGAVTIGEGDSMLQTEGSSGGFTFGASSTTSLLGVLRLDNNLTRILAGATFTGTGQLINMPGRQLSLAHDSNLGVMVENRGTLIPGTTGVAHTGLSAYQQTSTGNLTININGTSAASYDRLIINDTAQLAGTLTLSLGSGYVPQADDVFTILTSGSASSVTGTFSSTIQPASMPAGMMFEVIYTTNTVEVKVVSNGTFENWIDSFPSLTDPADKTWEADPDGDGLNNLGEFALDGDPTNAANNGKVVGKIAPVGGINALTLTLPVRAGTVADPADPAGGELGLKQSSDGLFYKIQASDDLITHALTVIEVTGADATAIQSGLPTLNLGWTYRSFRSPGPVTGDPTEFMRVKISN